MTYKILLSIGYIIFGFSSLAAANMVDIEYALMRHDYGGVQQLSGDLLKNSSSQDATQLRYYLGLSALRLKQYKSAEKSFKSLIEGSPLSVDLRDKVYLALIDLYFFTKKYDDAEKMAQTFLHLNPQSDYLSLLYFKLARVEFKQSEWMDARLLLRKIMNEHKNSLDVYLAEQFLKEKQFFSVQVGAFRDRSRAQDLVSELKAKGEVAYIVEIEDYAKRKFYRVRVGQISHLNKAVHLKEKLAKQGYPTKVYP